ncbi:hypothetical protein [Microcoleus sp. B3-D7]|uniref:hypothetical protein n=1 Tax=Microcoleus sp. B3-D7 TaxID=2818659 RepID=UPI002FD22945
MFTAVSEVQTGRQVKALALRSVNPEWGRRDFCKVQLRRSWVTVNEWDKLLAFTLDDYLTDPATGEYLWAPRQAWNAHQQWVLKKVKKWMSRTPKPTYTELEEHLASNQHLYNHQQFWKEFEEFYATKRACENTEHSSTGTHGAG